MMDREKHLHVLRLLQLIKLRKQERRKRPSFWCRTLFKHRDEFLRQFLNSLRMEDARGFKSLTRLTPVQFERILGAVAPRLLKLDVVRDSIKPEHQLAMVLSFYAHGSDYQILSIMFKMSESSVSRSVVNVTQALIYCLQEYLKVSFQLLCGFLAY